MWAILLDAGQFGVDGPVRVAQGEWAERSAAR